MIYQELERFVDKKIPFALVAVIEKRGSGPVSMDSRMAVTFDDSIGTVGGGVLEARAKERAVSCLENGSSEVIQFVLREDGNVDLICGGEVKLFIKPFLPENPDYRLMEKAIRFSKQGTDVCMGFVISPFEGVYLHTGSTGEDLGIPEGIKERIKELCEQTAIEGKSRFFKNEFSAFIEYISRKPMLVLFGGGHVSYYLSKIASLNGFSITVIDDRPEYANRERFPEAERVIAGDYGEVTDSLTLDGNTYIVIQTRGHEIDKEVLKRVINSNAVYISMIGSRRKVNLIFRRLREEGIPEDLLRRVRAPVGLDIGSETPPEIAVSIMAQIIMERRKK